MHHVGRIIIHTFNPSELALFLIFMWAAAARPGCTLLLRLENIGTTETTVKMRFTEGKGVTMRRRPYTVHSTLGEFHVWVQNALPRRRGYLFSQRRAPKIRARALLLMRQSDREYEQYSFRRGAAIAMHRSGVPVSTVRRFTGHASDDMTERYLEWGWYDLAQAQENAVSSMHLW